MAAGKNIVLGLLLLTVTFAAGCARGGDDSAFNALASRLERLERRVAATDSHAELAELERRLGNIEARLAAVEARGAVAEEGHDSAAPAANVNAPGDSGSAAGSPSTRAETLPERNQGAKSVAREDRARLARIREQFRDNPDPAARRQAMSEVRAWRRAQVEALRQRENASGESK